MGSCPPWTSTGFKHFSWLNGSLTRHEESKAHLDSSRNAKLFLSRTDPTSSATIVGHAAESIQETAEQVRKNREYVNRLFKVVQHLGIHGQAFRGNDESEDSINQGLFRATFNLLEAERPLKDKIKVTGSMGFKGTSAEIQNELIKIYAEAVMEEIKAEVTDAPFFSILADETTDLTGKNQLSLVLRYVSGSEVRESFIGFYNVSGEGGAVKLSERILDLLTNYNIRNIVGQSYDGASLMSGWLAGVQKLVRDKCPMAVFTHCLSHRLNLAMEASIQSLACNRVLVILDEMSKFFRLSFKRTDVLTCSRPPAVSDTRWNNKSRQLAHLIQNRDAYLACFKGIRDDTIPGKVWTPATQASATLFVTHLESAEFLFVERLLHRAFQITDVLYTQLQSVGLNITSANKLIEVQLEKLNGLDSEEVFRELKTGVDMANITFDAREELSSVVWNMTEELTQRFESLSELTFLNLLDRKVKVEPLVDALMTSPYGHLFEKGRLLSDLICFRDSPELGEDPITILREICRLKMDEYDLRELAKFTKLVLTIPLTSVSCERSFSSLKFIKTRLRTRMLDDRLNHLSILKIGGKRAAQTDIEKLVDTFAAKKPRNIRLTYSSK
eukprot:sb/3463096/